MKKRTNQLFNININKAENYPVFLVNPKGIVVPGRFIQNSYDKQMRAYEYCIGRGVNLIPAFRFKFSERVGGSQHIRFYSGTTVVHNNLNGFDNRENEHVISVDPKLQAFKLKYHNESVKKNNSLALLAKSQQGPLLKGVKGGNTSSPANSKGFLSYKDNSAFLGHWEIMSHVEDCKVIINDKIISTLDNTKVYSLLLSILFRDPESGRVKGKSPMKSIILNSDVNLDLLCSLISLKIKEVISHYDLGNCVVHGAWKEWLTADEYNKTVSRKEETQILNSVIEGEKVLLEKDETVKLDMVKKKNLWILNMPQIIHMITPLLQK
jgi:hypothetical protein